MFRPVPKNSADSQRFRFRYEGLTSTPWHNSGTRLSRCGDLSVAQRQLLGPQEIDTVASVDETCAQDMGPRAYSAVPIDTSFLLGSYFRANRATFRVSQPDKQNGTLSTGYHHPAFPGGRALAKTTAPNHPNRTLGQ